MTLWSKGDIVWTHEPLETFSHRLGGHIPIARDKFLQISESYIVIISTKELTETGD